MLWDEVRRMRNGYYELFLKTGRPAFYLLAKYTEEREEHPDG